MSLPKAADAKRRDWYFVCPCGAKFFCQVQGVKCPRCGEALQSREQIEPPWRKSEAGAATRES